MKNKKSISIGFVLCSLLSFAAMLHGASNDDRYVDPSLIRSEVNGMGEYVGRLENYIRDCEESTRASKLTNDELAQCIEKLKEISRQLPGFVRNGENIVAKIKNANKWSRELDEDFEKNAAKRGVDAANINEAKRQGGLRQSYDKGLRSVSEDGKYIEKEITDLQASLMRRRSSNLQPSFQTASFNMTLCGVACKHKRVANYLYLVW